MVGGRLEGTVTGRGRREEGRTGGSEGGRRSERDVPSLLSLARFRRTEHRTPRPRRSFIHPFSHPPILTGPVRTNPRRSTKRDLSHLYRTSLCHAWIVVGRSPGRRCSVADEHRVGTVACQNGRPDERRKCSILPSTSGQRRGQ